MPHLVIEELGHQAAVETTYGHHAHVGRVDRESLPSNPESALNWRDVRKTAYWGKIRTVQD